MSHPKDDYYRRLQIPRSASPTEIKAAFRRLARQYHPDLNPHQVDAHEKFQGLREAYEVLIDRVQRQRYDSGAHTGDFQAATAVPKTPQDFYLRGIHHSLSRLYQEAYNDFTEAIERQPDFVEAYLRRAQTRYVLGDDAGVLADCQRLLQLTPNHVQAFYYQGLGRYRLGYTESAIAAFTAALKIEPDDPQTYYQRGLAYEDIQEMENAISDFQKAARYFREQGDLLNHQRLSAHLHQLNVPVSGRPRIILWPRLVRFNALFFGLLGNPVGEILPLYARLSARQAAELGCLLALIANGSFTLGSYILQGDPLPLLTLLKLWLIGSVTFLTLAVTLVFCRSWFRRRGRWSAEILIAGATLLPVGVFVLVSPMALMGGPWFWLLLMFFTTTHMLLTLYTGCTQIQHLSESIAIWVVPSLLFVSGTIGYLVWILLS